jgi:hypothetical protein
MTSDCGILGCDTVITARFKVVFQDLLEWTEKTMKSLILNISFLLVRDACTNVVPVL